MGSEIDGLDAFKRKLEGLEKNAVRLVANKAMNAGLRVLAEGIKGQIPPQYSGLASLVGKRIDTSRSGDSRGQVVGKVGFGVARRGGRKTGRKRGGVGISANNIHWLVLGTKERSTKSGANRGTMPAVLADCVPKGMEYSNDEAIKEMNRVFKETLANL